MKEERAKHPIPAPIGNLKLAAGGGKRSVLGEFFLQLVMRQIRAAAGKKALDAINAAPQPVIDCVIDASLHGDHRSDGKQQQNRGKSGEVLSEFAKFQ